MEDLPADLGGPEQALLDWRRTVSSVRPHQVLGYKTQDQFYHHRLNTNATGKEVLSDIYLTPYTLLTWVGNNW